ncbi:DNA repair protein Rad34p [[Candida] jaroonii]|uniref:DNA repair protein Rad34p n=1 Tax=[Candida] jaroonii TaxID=467808 RepID=A0ACA9YDH7_9ASCO|nr:DNA repair protein Rad34p [[Candida] jaroonii]
MDLFIDESDSDSEPTFKRPSSFDSPEDTKRTKVESDHDFSDYELSESDLEWEDILPEVDEPNKPENDKRQDHFSIQLNDDSHKKDRIRRIIENKNRKLTIHNLGLLSYMLHAHLRNKLINDKHVQKTLKKLLPEEVVKRVKKLKKSIAKEAGDCDVQLIYIVKYLIKWFRLNFKITCNGLRVLGFLPSTNHDEYFMNNAPTFSNLKSFISLIKKFNHNRDFGAQLFTGLLRALGFEARMVFSVPVIQAKSKKYQPKLDRKKLETNRDFDLLYPYFWTELINPINPQELLVIETCTFHDEDKRLSRISRFSHSLKSHVPLFYPVQDQFNDMTMTYVVSLDNNNHVLDVSSRYMKNICYRYFHKIDLRMESGKSLLLYLSIIRMLNRDTLHDEGTVNRELDCLRWLGTHNYEIPQTKSAISRNPNFTTPDTLRYDEVLNGDKPLTKVLISGVRTPVYFKSSVIVGKSEQQWKFLGRSVRPEHLDKFIKTTKSLLPRTIYRRRLYELNINNNQPELNTVKLYSFTQTCPYIKQKVIDGQLPKNKYGNIEIYRDSMIPEDCEWLKLSDIEAILRDKSNTSIRFVPVVTGFKFNKLGYAIPDKTGVIVLSEQSERAKKFWIASKIRQRKLQQKLKEEVALHNWYQLIKRLKIKKRLLKEYGK